MFEQLAAGQSSVWGDGVEGCAAAVPGSVQAALDSGWACESDSKTSLHLKQRVP